MKVILFSNNYGLSLTDGHGTARYARQLSQELTNFSDLNLFPTTTWSSCSTNELNKFKKENQLKIVPGGRKLTPLAWLLLNNPPIEYLLKDSIDITHILALGFPVATRKKLVVTVHDIGPLTHPSYFSDSPAYLFKRSFEQMANQADAIVCVSQATADEVVEYGGEHLSSRIFVVHEGVEDSFTTPVSIDLYQELNNLPPQNTPFFLSAGAMSPRKNIGRVLEAFSRVHDLIPHHLALVGGKGWDSEAIFNKLQDSNCSSKVHHLGYVSEQQLKALYQSADFYIHPSLFEGFGLTVLEAMAAGCPVITSNISSLPEIAGNAACLINPFSVTDIAEAIENFALNEPLRQKYPDLGLQRVKNFQWKDTAESIANIYRSL